MNKSNKILLLLAFTLCMSFGSVAKTFGIGEYYYASENTNKDTMSVLITINGASYALMHNVAKTGYIEIYSILGQKVTRINLKDCEGGTYDSLTLPKGLYILKAGRVAQKVIVK